MWEVGAPFFFRAGGRARGLERLEVGPAPRQDEREARAPRHGEVPEGVPADEKKEEPRGSGDGVKVVVESSHKRFL